MFRFILGRKTREKETRKTGLPDVHIDTAYYCFDRPASMILVRAKNTPGVISSIANIISSRNINIVKANVPEPAVEEEGYVVFLLENCDESCVKEIKKDIQDRLSDKILSVETIPSTNSYVFLKYNKLKLLNKESLVLTYKILENGIYRVYNRGSIGSLFLLVDFGRGLGEGLYEDYVADIVENYEGDFEEKVDLALNLFKMLYKAMGLGDVEIRQEEGEEGFYEIRIRDNFECSALKKYGSQHGFVGKTGNITSGLISGFFEQLFNRVVEVQEVRCINEGYSEDVFRVYLKEYKMY